MATSLLNNPNNLLNKNIACTPLSGPGLKMIFTPSAKKYPEKHN
jgi:hypothetical protein